MRLERRMGVVLLFALAGAVIMQVFTDASLRGAFVAWQKLGQPPSKPIEIVGLDYVRTISGDIFQYSGGDGCEADCWTKADALPHDLPPELPLSTCGHLPSLDRYVQSKAECRYYGTGMFLAITAMDSNGDIYSWGSATGGEGNSLIRLLSPVLDVGAGIICGLIAFLVLFFAKLMRRLEDKAKQNAVSS